MKHHPLVYEINTRCWLRELSEREGTRVMLGNVPESEFERWRSLGFTHIWLMGVWVTGARSRACSRSLGSLRKSSRELLPDLSIADILGSPFAPAAYEVSRTLGGESGLKKFRNALAHAGLKLLLDFIPNHTGLDHRWLREHPEFFVQSPKPAPETFLEQTDAGRRWIAHGKDPYFPAWIDTAQLDYRNPDTVAAVVQELRTVTEWCDGVRCDMAMLVLKDIFARTWSRFPSAHAAPDGEFWAEAISAIKQSRPDFLFLAEVYWDLEARLQQLGFDYAYDKRLYDYLVSRNYPEVRRHLFGVSSSFLEASAHFLENHDELRITSRLSWPEHRAAALVTLAVPGLRLVYEGQMAGASAQVSVHVGRRPKEMPELEVMRWYQQTLTALQSTVVGRGRGEIIRTKAAWDDNPTWQDFIIVQWQGEGAAFDLAVVNLSEHTSQAYAVLTARGLGATNWSLKNLLGGESYERRGDDLQGQGLYLEVPAHGTQLFHCEPIG